MARPARFRHSHCGADRGRDDILVLQKARVSSMMLMRIERAAFWVARVLAAAGLLLLLAFAAARLADGLLRWLFGMPITAVRDLDGLVAAVSVACCFPIALLERSNITIRFVETFWNEQASHGFDALAAMLTMAIMGLIAWQLLLYAGQEAASGDTTWMLGIPVAPFWYLIDAIFWCAAAVQTVVTARQIGRWWKPGRHG